MAIKFEDVVKLAEQLNADQQNLLIYRLRVKQMRGRHLQTTPVAAQPSFDNDREQLLAEAARLRQQPVHAENSLFGSYANLNLPDMTAEEFHAQMHSITTEWEQELDEFSDDQL